MREIAAALLILATGATARMSTAQAGRSRITSSPRPPAVFAKTEPGDRNANAGCLLAALAAALLLPFPVGVITAPGVFLIARALVRRLPAPKPRPLPPHVVASCADLLAACLEAGAVPSAALIATGASLPGPLGTSVTEAGRALANGETVEEALPETGDLASIAAVFRRSSRTGSAITDQLIAVAAELRAQDQFDQLERAHRVGVMSALPLALCMLPAFLLLAVVPAVAGLGRGLVH